MDFNIISQLFSIISIQAISKIYSGKFKVTLQGEMLRLVLNELVQSITPTFIDGFLYDLAYLFFIMSRDAISNIFQVILRSRTHFKVEC